MGKYTVAAIVGSLRKDSHNLKLAKAIARLAAPKLELKIVNISDLPLFNQDLEAEFPASATRLKQDIDAANAVLIVTPEYNRGIPGPLKNAIDWASRPYGKNSFSQKPTAICGASVGTIGTACAQQALKPILNYLDVILMGQPEVYFHFKENAIDFDGKIHDENTEKFIQNFVDRFVGWIEKNS